MNFLLNETEMNNRKIVIKNMKNVNEKTTTDLDVSSHLDSKENKSVYLTNIKRLFDLNSKSRQGNFHILSCNLPMKHIEN